MPRKVGLTLDDVERFCARARELNVAGDTIMQAGVSFGGKLYQLEVDTVPK
jgi:hypothetical protein